MKSARFSCAAALLATLIGVLALLGWAFDLPLLHSTFPGLPSMVPATATLVILTATGLLLTPARSHPHAGRSLAAFACAAAVTLASFALLLGMGSLALPSPATSLILLLLGVALALLQAPRPSIMALSALSVFTLTLPLYRLTECLLTLGEHHSATTDAFATTSLNSAVALCLLAGPALFLHPRLPFGRSFFAPDSLGSLLRIVMPWSAITPVALAVVLDLSDSLTGQGQHLHFSVVTALALLSALASALMWSGYGKLRASADDLQKTEALTRSIMDSLPHAVAVIDRNGTIIGVNQSWRDFAIGNQADKSTLLGTGLNYLAACRNATQDATAQEALRGIEDVINGLEGEFTLEYPCHSPESQRWFLMRVNPLLGSTDEVVISHIDITERKLAETALREEHEQMEAKIRERTEELSASEARTRAVLHTMADGVIQIDATGRILLANYAVSSLFGYEAEELLGHNVSRLMPEPHRSQHDGYLANYLRTRTGKVIGQRVEVEGRRKDGSTFPLEMAINELVDDHGNTFIGVLRDMTLHQQMRDAQAAALAEAKRLTDVKSTFLANMSHEIRTPLGAVMGFARIGMRENQGRNSHATCARILEAGEHLLGVVNDILDFSKIEAGKLRIEAYPFPLAAAIDASRMFVAETARSKGLELATDIAGGLPAWVMGDALRIEQILTNLLSNAVKFTSQGHVTLKVSQASGSSLRFRVEDTGIGMSAEQLGRLFHAFEQADSSTTREYGGTGLGLAISRRLAQMMGGDISAASTPGAGSIFTLELPLPAASPTSEQSPVSTAASRRLAGLRLLAADDVEANRLILDDLLAHEGARTILAADGQQALDLLDEHGCEAFDAVLMDVQMPVLDGFATTRAIRKRAPWLPVIGLTAHALAEERDKCLAAGMVDHITKPVDPEVLVAAILSHVARAPAAAEVAPPPAVLPEPSFTGQLIDLPALRARFNRKEDFLRKLALSALTSLDSSEQQLAAAIAKCDYEALAFTAHSLKGIAGNLFAQPMFDLAKSADEAARDKKPAALEQAGQLARLLAAFRAELQTLASPADGADR